MSGQTLAAPVDIKGEHRHRRLERRALAAFAGIGRALERPRDAGGATKSEYALLQIERVTVLGHALRPAFRRCGGFRFRSRWHGLSCTFREFLDLIRLAPH